jgi:hypothetical protein
VGVLLGNIGVDEDVIEGTAETSIGVPLTETLEIFWQAVRDNKIIKKPIDALNPFAD